MSSLTVSSLAGARGERVLFAGLDFELGAGEALWVQGPNGAGKSTLLRLLCGLSEPAHGRIFWNGEDIRRLREDYRHELMLLGHAAGVKDDLLAWENVYYGALIAGHPCTAAQAREALAHLGLSGVAHLPARVLSQGQRKRVALARLCLPQRPRLLVLDEAFTALDQAAVQTLTHLLGEHLGQGGLIVYTTHQPITVPTGALRRLDLSAGAPAC
ncbi:MAG TPA: cytochrome c biogenesis heme-transporting ATPase CcmA [Candidatus Aquabacterium excrementipullorum]|nr:cytochrome c biogenesis heme-transporting ATPase CcmA [Candidatus Aquabacterium excrementipullorum]